MAPRAPRPRDAVEAVQSIPEEQLLRADPEVLALSCLSALGWDQSKSVALGAIHHHFDNACRRLVVHVPVMDPSDEFRGVQLLKRFGNFGKSSCGAERVVEVEAQLPAAADVTDSELLAGISQILATVRDLVDEDASAARGQLDARRAEALRRIREELRERVRVERAIAQAKSDLGIPLTPDSSASAIQLQPVQQLDLDAALARANRGSPERALDEAIRNDILRTIVGFSNALQRLPVTAGRLADLDEEALRDVLLFLINSRWKTATGEAFSGTGKTDIQLLFDQRVAFTAELKIYHGYKAVQSAIDQLTGYMVWRDTHAALLVIIRDRKQVEAAIDEVKRAVLEHPRYLSGPGPKEVTPRYTLATADATRTISLDLITVPLVTLGVVSSHPSDGDVARTELDGRP